jgi:hypothetical protein
MRYEFYRGDIIPPAHKWRASRAVPSGLEGTGIVSPRLIGGRCGRDDEGRVASKISYSYPDAATPEIFQHSPYNLNPDLLP